MVTLDDFTNGEPPAEPPEVPRFRKKNAVHNPNYNREKCGFTCKILNRGDDGPARGYVSSRKTDPNLFRKFDSYPITTKILARLQYEEVERILIIEDDVDTGETNVYEFTVEQYLSAPEYEWTRYEEGREFVDAQKCPSREDALHVFEDVSRRDLRPEAEG